MQVRRCLFSSACLTWGLLCLAPSAASETHSDEVPGWAFSANVRLRTEYLADSFRLLAPQQDHLQLSRSELGARYQGASWSFEFEVQDSRAWGEKTFSPLGTDDVNTLEPINVKVQKNWR